MAESLDKYSSQIYATDYLDVTHRDLARPPLGHAPLAVGGDDDQHSRGAGDNVLTVLNQVVSSPEVDIKSGVMEDSFPVYRVLTNKADMQFMCTFSSLVALWGQFSTRLTTFLTVRQVTPEIEHKIITVKF